MAKVEMDLAELKQLEAKIEDLENKVVLKEKEKQEILDKQPMVTVLHKYFKPSYSLKGNVNGISLPDITVTLTRDSYDHVGRRELFNRQTRYYELDRYVDIKLDESNRVEKDYKGMSEVVSDIRVEEELKVKELLDSARERATKAEYESSVVKDEYEKKILKLNDDHSSTLDNFSKEYNAELKLKDDYYAKLNQEFSDFKEDKKRITLEQQITELTEKLKEATRPKSFTQRLLNK